MPLTRISSPVISSQVQHPRLSLTSYFAAAAGLMYPHPDDDKLSEISTHRAKETDMPLTGFDDSFVPAAMPTMQLPASSPASSVEPSLVS
jgi:hypothetical protein